MSFCTRSVTLTVENTERVLELGIRQLDFPKETVAVGMIFYKPFRPPRRHGSCSRASEREAFPLSKCFPIVIATVAALTRNEAVCGTTTNVLRQIAAKSPPSA